MYCSCTNATEITRGLPYAHTHQSPRLQQVNFERVAEHKESKDCTIPMGATSDEVASRFHVTRAEQDAFAASSHAKAQQARAAGKFKEEIVPVRASVFVR